MPAFQQFEFRPLDLNILRLLLYTAYIVEWQVSACFKLHERI